MLIIKIHGFPFQAAAAWRCVSDSSDPPSHYAAWLEYTVFQLMNYDVDAGSIDFMEDGVEFRASIMAKRAEYAQRIITCRDEGECTAVRECARRETAFGLREIRTMVREKNLAFEPSIPPFQAFPENYLRTTVNERCSNFLEGEDTDQTRRGFASAVGTLLLGSIDRYNKLINGFRMVFNRCAKAKYIQCSLDMGIWDRIMQTVILPISPHLKAIPHILKNLTDGVLNIDIVCVNIQGFIESFAEAVVTLDQPLVDIVTIGAFDLDHDP